MRTVATLLGLSLGACATRGHIATPLDVAVLRGAGGLSTSGKISLSGPRGRYSARVVLGVARPDSLRLEIPAGTGLRFLLVSRGGKLRADLPEDDAMFEGPGTRATMNGLFGIDVGPEDLVNAILGLRPSSVKADWRFESALPTQVTIHGPEGTKLVLRLDDPVVETPDAAAFDFGRPRGRSFSLKEMSDRLGLRR